MSKALSAVLAGLARAGAWPQRRWARLATLARTAERLVPSVTVETAAGPIAFHCPSKTALYWPRAGLADEPATVDWLDRMAPGAVLWDVGANVGVFALYAARRGLDVYAFEPNPYSFDSLVRNVALNGIEDRVHALCLALGASRGLDSLYLTNVEAGSVCNALGLPEGGRAGWATGGARVAALALTIDDLVSDFALPPPTHLKIDVDSIEDRILAGARGTLGRGGVESVLVELSHQNAEETAQSERILALMAEVGYRPTVERGAEPIFNQIFRPVMAA
jgi:FkbM family methyltransferase